jgi:membrane protein YdbS with pleckstrin-like domain
MSIQFACPACARPLSVKQELAGKSARCPHCGATLRVPGPEQAAVVRKEESSGLAGAHQPAAPPPLPGPAKQVPAGHAPAGDPVLWWGHPRMFRGEPTRFLALIVAVAAGGAICWALAAVTHSPKVGLVAALVILAVVGMIVLTWWLRCRYSTLTVTEKRSILDTGYLSRATNELRHVDVRNIEVNQTFLQRLFGTGSIEISTAASDEGEIAISGILEPQRVATLIRERQDSGQS